MGQVRRDGSRARWVVVLVIAAIAGLWWWTRAWSVEQVEVARVEEAAPVGVMTGPRGVPVIEVDPRFATRAAIAGLVTDTQGRAIAGAQVCAKAESPRLVYSENRRAHCTTSGRDGRYRIDGLFAVDHRVTASAAGYIPAAYRRAASGPRRLPGRRDESVALRAGTEARGIDLSLEGGGVEIHGVVKDLSGGAIEGAQVSILELGFAYTDAEGRFRGWARPGAAYVYAEAEGYASKGEFGAAPGHLFTLYLTPESVLIGRVVRASDGAPIEGARVTANDPSSYDATFTDVNGNFRIDRLNPGPYKPHAEADDAFGQAEEQVVLGLGETSAPLVVRAHPAVYVEGAVVVAGGEACDHANVSLMERGANRQVIATRTPDGLMRARGVLPGDYEMFVECPGYMAEESYPHVVVADANVTGLRWAVTAGRAIRGRVVDAEGKPVAGVMVSGEMEADPEHPRARRTDGWSGVATDESGRFELAGLLPGGYALVVSGREVSRAVPARALEVNLLEGQDLEDVVIELPATGEVQGSVRDANGRPLAGVTVALIGGPQRQSASVDDQGTFRLPHVAPGEYRVVASLGWQTRLRAPGTRDDDVQGEPVTVREGGVEEVKLVVEASDGQISGVVRGADGAPVADAFIEAVRESDSPARAAGASARMSRWSFNERPNLTDQDGRFTIAGLPHGPHTIRAHRKGGGEALVEHVAIGSEVVLTIEATGRMSGTVSVRGGEPPAEFTVGVYDEKTGFDRRDTFFRTAGAWSLPELPAGTYRVGVSAGGNGTEVVVNMTAGEDTTGVRVELVPKVNARGIVVDLEGRPVAGMEVSVVSSSGGRSLSDEGRRHISDAAGRYELSEVPAGKVQVGVSPTSGDSEYMASTISMVIDASAPTIELAPLRVARRRLRPGEAAGDFGYVIKESEPGADPLLRRLIVAVVRPGGPAAQAGLKVGDEVVRVDGQEVTGGNSGLASTLQRVPAGTAVRFGLADGRELTITAAARP